MTASDLLPSHPLRIASLAARKPTRFDLQPDAAARAAIAADLGLLALPEFRFKGELRPQGRSDWLLEAELKALAEQPCSVTLVPVPARIAETVRRTYIADLPEPEGEEVEMPEDDTQEPLPEVVDVYAVAIEALELALPAYPRAPGVELGEAVFAAPGVAPLRDEDLRPFSGLAGLAQKLAQGKDDSSGEDGPDGAKG